MEKFIIIIIITPMASLDSGRAATDPKRSAVSATGTFLMRSLEVQGVTVTRIETIFRTTRHRLRGLRPKSGDLVSDPAGGKVFSVSAVRRPRPGQLDLVLSRPGEHTLRRRRAGA